MVSTIDAEVFVAELWARFELDGVSIDEQLLLAQRCMRQPFSEDKLGGVLSSPKNAGNYLSDTP